MPKRKKAKVPTVAPPEADVAQRIAEVLHFARFAGPTGAIEEILEDIERGRGLPA